MPKARTHLSRGHPGGGSGWGCKRPRGRISSCRGGKWKAPPVGVVERMWSSHIPPHPPPPVPPAQASRRPDGNSGGAQAEFPQVPLSCLSLPAKGRKGFFHRENKGDQSGGVFFSQAPGRQPWDLAQHMHPAGRCEVFPG